LYACHVGGANVDVCRRSCIKFVPNLTPARRKKRNGNTAKHDEPGVRTNDPLNHIVLLLCV
jgi:hypothetical protein